MASLPETRKWRGIRRKKALVALSGGGCEICGYNRNLAALCFHHIDPEQKKFGLSTKTISHMSLSVIIREYNKCICVCQNCHAEIHNGEYTDYLRSTLQGEVGVWLNLAKSTSEDTHEHEESEMAQSS